MVYENDVRSTNSAPKETETAVFVAGAGPTGLTLALDLARRNIAVRIVDAAPAPFAGSRGKGIQPRTLEIFEQLGIATAIAQAGAPYPIFRTHLGPLSFRMGSIGTREPVTATRPHPNLWMVPQFRTEAILRARLAEFGVTVEQSAGVTEFIQDADGVTATLASGERVRAAYLVGCDGGKSTVRRVLGLALYGETLPQKGLFVADVAVPDLDRGNWHTWPLARGGVVGLCPLPGTDLFQLTGPATLEKEGAVAAVRRVSGCTVTRVDWQSTYQPHVRMVDRYRVGRVFLAGDAAHLHPPAGGQGLNTGVQDAWNLGWKLAWALRGGAPSAILDSYEAERLPIAAAVLDLTKKLHVKRSIKRGELTNQLALHYRESALSSGAPLGSLHAGDRLADEQWPNGQRLHELLRGTGAVELRREDRYLLVRPDGYIARVDTVPFADADGYAGEPVRRLS